MNNQDLMHILNQRTTYLSSGIDGLDYLSNDYWGEDIFNIFEKASIGGEPISLSQLLNTIDVLFNILPPSTMNPTTYSYDDLFTQWSDLIRMNLKQMVLEGFVNKHDVDTIIKLIVIQKHAVVSQKSRWSQEDYVFIAKPEDITNQLGLVNQSPVETEAQERGRSDSVLKGDQLIQLQKLFDLVRRAKKRETLNQMSQFVKQMRILNSVDTKSIQPHDQQLTKVEKQATIAVETQAGGDNKYSQLLDDQYNPKMKMVHSDYINPITDFVHDYFQDNTPGIPMQAEDGLFDFQRTFGTTKGNIEFSLRRYNRAKKNHIGQQPFPEYQEWCKLRGSYNQSFYKATSMGRLGVDVDFPKFLKKYLQAQPELRKKSLHAIMIDPKDFKFEMKIKSISDNKFWDEVVQGVLGNFKKQFIIPQLQDEVQIQDIYVTQNKDSQETNSVSFLTVEKHRPIAIMLGSKEIAKNFVLIITESGILTHDPLQILVLTSHYVYYVEVVFSYSTTGARYLSYLWVDPTTQQKNMGSVKSHNYLGDIVDNKYVIRSNDLIKTVQLIKDQVQDSYNIVGRSKLYQYSPSASQSSTVDFQFYLRDHLQMPFNIIQHLRWTDISPFNKGNSISLADLNEHMLINLKNVYEFFKDLPDEDKQDIFVQGSLRMYTYLIQTLDMATKTVYTIDHFTRLFYSNLLVITLTDWFANNSDEAVGPAIIKLNSTMSKFKSAFIVMTSSSQLWRAFVDEFIMLIESIPDDDGSQVALRQEIINQTTEPMVHYTAKLLDKSGHRVFGINNPQLDQDFWPLALSIDTDMSNAVVIQIDPSTNKFMYFGQSGETQLLTASQVVDYKNKNQWQQLMLRPISDELFPAQIRQQVRFNSDMVAQHLIYAILQGIKYDFKISYIYDTDKEEQVTNYQLLKEILPQLENPDLGQRIDRLTGITIREDIIDNPMSQQFNVVTQYKNERSFQTQTIRNSTIKAILTVAYRNPQFKPLVMRLAQTSNQFYCGSGVSPIGLFNRAQSWIKAHQMIVNSYNTNYNTDIAKWTSGSNVYINELNDDNETKNIPMNFMSFLVEYKMNTTKEFEQILKPSIQELFKAYKKYSRGPLSASTGFLLNQVRSKSDDEEMALSLAMVENTNFLTVDVELNFQPALKETDTDTMLYDTIQLLFDKNIQRWFKINNLNNSKQIHSDYSYKLMLKDQKYIQHFKGYMSLQTYIDITQDNTQQQSLFSDLVEGDTKGLMAQQLRIGSSTIQSRRAYPISKILQLISKGLIKVSLQIRQTTNEFNERFVDLIENNCAQSVCVNKLEEYEAIKYKPQKMDEQAKKEIQQVINQTVHNVSQRLLLKNMLETGDYSKQVIRIVNGVNFFIHHLAACLRDCVKGSLQNNYKLISHDMINADPLSIMQQYFLKYEQAQKKRLEEQNIIPNLKWQAWSMMQSYKWGPISSGQKTIINPRYVMINYSDNLYVVTAKGVHISFDLTKSESGSQQKHVYMMWSWFLSVFQQQLKHKGFQEEQIYDTCEKLFAHLIKYNTRSCHSMETYLGQFLIQVPGLQSGVPNTFFINHIRSSLLIYFDQFVSPILTNEFLDYIESAQVHSYIRINQNMNLKLLCLDDVFAGIKPVNTYMDANGATIKIMTSRAARLCVENSMAWKIEKVTCICKQCQGEFNQFDTDMLGLQMVKISGNFLPSLDSDRAVKAILFSKDQGLQSLIMVVGSALQNSKPAQRYSLGQIKTQKFINMGPKEMGQACYSKFQQLKDKIIIRKSAMVNGIQRPYRDNLMAIFWNGQCLAFDVLQSVEILTGEKELQIYNFLTDLIEALIHILDFAKLYALQYFIQGQPELQVCVQQQLINQSSYFQSLGSDIASVLTGVQYDKNLAKEMQKNSEGLISEQIAQQAFNQLPNIFKEHKLTFPQPLQIAMVLTHSTDQSQIPDRLVDSITVEQNVLSTQYAKEEIVDIKENSDSISSLDQESIMNKFFKYIHNHWDYKNYVLVTPMPKELDMLLKLPEKYQNQRIRLRVAEYLRLNLQAMTHPFIFSTLYYQYKIGKSETISKENQDQIIFNQIPIHYRIIKHFMPTNIQVFIPGVDGMHYTWVGKSNIIMAKGQIVVQRDDLALTDHEQFTAEIDRITKHVSGIFKNTGALQSQWFEIILSHVLQFCFPWAFRMRVLVIDSVKNSVYKEVDETDAIITYPTFTGVLKILILQNYGIYLEKQGYDMTTIQNDLFKLFSKWDKAWFGQSQMGNKITIVERDPAIDKILSDRG